MKIDKILLHAIFILLSISNNWRNKLVSINVKVVVMRYFNYRAIKNKVNTVTEKKNTTLFSKFFF